MRFEGFTRNLLRSIHTIPTRIGFAGLTAVIAMLLGSSAVSYGQDDVRPVTEAPSAIPTPPVLRRHIMLPSTALADPSRPRANPKPHVSPKVQPNAVNTGTGVVYTCDSTVPTSTCTYLNTTVAGYYNSVFTNANANIYIEFGDTGLGESDGYYNLVAYTPYITALTKNTGKSSVQTQALSAINTYATPVYGTQNEIGITVALGSVLGFTGLHGINSAENAECTPYTSGCYNEVITIANTTQQTAGGFSFYYDDQGGTEGPEQYDFYGVVMHETDEVLGTSSCIDTGSTTLEDGCDGPDPGSNGIPSVVDLDRYKTPGTLAVDTTPSTAAGQYFSFNGGVDYGAYGAAGTDKVYNTLSNGQDFSDYVEVEDCGQNIAIQDAVGCPGADQGLTVLNDGQSEFVILNAIGFNIPVASMTSPTPGSTLPGTSATFTWKAATAATDYVLYVGTTGVGSFDIFQNASTPSTATSQAVTGLPTTGTVYVRVWSDIDGFYSSVDYTYTAGTAAPAVTLSPTSLTFASTTVGSTTAAQTVTVKNTGTATLTLTSETLTGTNASSFVISANTCSTSLAASATCAVSVEFKPTAAGALTASLSVADNATGSPQTATLSGTGTAATAPAVTLSPTSLTFASTAEGATTAAQTVTVKNSGTAALTLTSETLTGADPSSFVISANTCTTSLAVGATCAVSVEFKPAATGALTASLSIADNATGSPQSATLSGTGTGSATVTLSNGSLTFASTSEGSTSGAQKVTVTNSGTSSLTLTSEMLTGTNASSFLISINTCTTSLAAGASCAITLEFKPVAVGALTASLSIADSATGSPQTVALKGTGVAGAAITLTPASLTFATTAETLTSAAQTTTVKNTTTAAVSLTSETLTGTDASSFVISANTCSTSLAAGATCAVSVEFKPVASGSLTAALSIADSATGSPQTATLSGTGAADPIAELSVTSMTFASTNVGSTSATQRVTISNQGKATMTLTSETLTGADASSYVITANTCGSTIAIYGNCAVTIEFKPVTTGTLTGALSIVDNAPGSPQTVALSGTGAGGATPTVTLTPTSITFPNTVTGTTSDAQIVTLTNTSAAAITISSIALGGTNATSFQEIGTCGATLAASASCSIYVAFDPASAAALTGTLSVTDNATGSPQKVTLSGTGTAAPSVKLSTTAISFPTTAPGSTSAAQAVTLTNSGTATLTLASIVLGGTNPTDFEELNTCGATLAPSASCVVYVAFKPAAAAAYSGKLTITDNGASSPQSVTLSGTGS